MRIFLKFKIRLLSFLLAALTVFLSSAVYLPGCGLVSVSAQEVGSLPINLADQQQVEVRRGVLCPEPGLTGGQDQPPTPAFHFPSAKYTDLRVRFQ